MIITKTNINEVPEHMREGAEYFGNFHFEHYTEAQCANCGKRIYRYMLDLLIVWKHTNHATHCHLDEAEPLEGTEIRDR
jgi:hypothetical protein